MDTKFLHNTYGVKITNDIASSTFGWPSMNIYELYYHIIDTNINLLRNSECNYILANLKSIQKNNGFEILELLEKHGFEFSKPFIPIEKHTKTNLKEKNKNYKNKNVAKYKLRNNKTVEKIVSKLSEKLEYRFQ